MFVFALFAGQVRSRIIVDDDAAATARNIRDSALLYRVCFTADLIEITCMLVAGLALYALFRRVNQVAATAMVAFVVAAVAIGSLNLPNQFTAWTVATDADYTSAFGQAQTDQLVLLRAGMQHNGYYISAMYWGLWLLPLGYLVVRSAFLPRFIGIALIVGGVGYVIDMFTRFLAPQVGATIGAYLVAPGGIAELILTLWLLIKAVQVPGQPAVLEQLAAPVKADASASR